VLKICQNNRIVRFSLNSIKFFLSLSAKTSQKATKAAPAVCSVVIKFLQEVMWLQIKTASDVIKVMIEKII